jgi:hypothetical protein
MNLPEMAALDENCASMFRRALKDNASAIDCLSKLFQIAHILDDLIDKDRTPTDDEIAAAFWLALVDVPENAFFQAHASVLRPILASAMLNWLTANKLEYGADEADHRIAFILRSSYVDLLSMGAFLVGGFAWATEIGPEIRRWVHDEGFDQYLLNLATEKGA